MVAGTIITSIILLMVIVGFFWMPYDPTKMDASAKLQGISLKHIMGTDNLGRDVFSRIMYGSRITLIIATGTVFIGAGIGTIIGAFTGYYGGMLDEIFMRIIDALFAFPSILLALVFVSLVSSGTYQVIIALGIAFIPSFARIVRSEVLRCKNMDYVECARLQGFPDHHTEIPWRGKPAEKCPRAPQYKAYGNSMCVNVIEWLGRCIEEELNHPEPFEIFYPEQQTFNF